MHVCADTRTNARYVMADADTQNTLSARKRDLTKETCKRTKETYKHTTRGTSW